MPSATPMHIPSLARHSPPQPSTQELLSLLRAEGIERYPNDLAGYYEQFRAQALEVASRATEATRGMDERVW